MTTQQEIYNKLYQLGEYFEAGFLSEEEFQRLKNQIKVEMLKEDNQENGNRNTNQ